MFGPFQRPPRPRDLKLAALSVSARWLLQGRNRVVRWLLDDLSDDEAERVSHVAYWVARNYAADVVQDKGLHPFERAFLDALALPAGSRVLVPACGGGREPVALLAEGLRVEASEPASPLRRAAAARIAQPVEGWTLQDLVRRSTAHSGPFDAVLVGWGAWGHVLRAEERVAVAQALLARLAPGGAVCLSWPIARTQGPRFSVMPGGSVSVALPIAQACDEVASAGGEVWHRSETGQGYPHLWFGHASSGG